MNVITKISSSLKINDSVIMIPVGESCNKEYAHASGIVKALDRDGLDVFIEQGYNKGSTIRFSINKNIWGYMLKNLEWDE